MLLRETVGHWSLLELHRLALLCLGGPTSPEEAPCSDRELLACRLSAFLRASAEHSGPVNEPSSLLAGLSTATAPAEAIKAVSATLRDGKEAKIAEVATQPGQKQKGADWCTTNASHMHS